MRLIDADAAIEFLTGLGNREYRSEKGTIREAIKALRHEEYTPTVDAEPVRHGHWVHENAWYPPTCSMCGGSPKTPGFIGNVEFYEKYFHRCPNCGAKMDEEVTK